MGNLVIKEVFHVSPNNPVSKPFSFSHTEDGMKQVKIVLNQIQTDTSVKPTIVLEATGNYSKSLVLYFQAIGYDVVLRTTRYPNGVLIT